MRIKDHLLRLVVSIQLAWIRKRSSLYAFEMRVFPYELKKSQTNTSLKLKGYCHYAKNSGKVVMTQMKLFGSVEDFSLSFSINEQCCSSHLIGRQICCTATCLQRPLFLADSSNTDSCLNLSKTATSLQRSLSSVPKVAVMARLNCSFR